METEEAKQAKQVEMYNYAVNLLVNQKKLSSEAIISLTEKGMDADAASDMVHNIETEIIEVKRKDANKDMLWGAVWCIGGTIATIADIGYIFYGAIIFGAIQFFRGLSNYSS